MKLECIINWPCRFTYEQLLHRFQNKGKVEQISVFNNNGVDYYIEYEHGISKIKNKGTVYL